jgi:hypothetical protein
MAKKLLHVWGSSLGIMAAAFGADGQGGRSVTISKFDDKLRVEINGELFTEYHFTGAAHVYYYPVIGPGGASMTRDWPMKEGVAGEEPDGHPHHRSLWYSHGAVNGIDFWAEGSNAGKILHDKFLEVKSGGDFGLIRSTCKWVGPDGTVPCTDERTFRVYARPNNERLFDFEITLKAEGKDIVFGDTKEGSMGFRVAESMRLKPNRFNIQKPTGHIVLSTGVREDETWGQHADWCDYYGPVNEKIVGAAIFDHPGNPRHPTTWHVRSYGLFAANPFGLHEFEKKPLGAGNMIIPAGKTVTFRYRFYLHEGNESQARVAQKYKEWVSDPNQSHASPEIK